MRISPKEKYPWYLRLLYWMQKRRFGVELIPPKIWGRSPLVFMGFSFFFKALDRKGSPIPADIRALMNVLISKINHCPFCIDMNSARVLDEGSSREKLEALEHYQTSSSFTDKERVSLEYAEAVTRTDSGVSDELFSMLKQHYSDDQIVELTGMIALQNCSSKFNAALDLPSQNLCQF